MSCFAIFYNVKIRFEKPIKDGVAAAIAVTQLLQFSNGLLEIKGVVYGVTGG